MKETILYRSPKDGEEFELAELRARAMRESLEKLNRYDENRAKQRLLGNYCKDFITVIESSNREVIGFYSVLIDGCTAIINHLYLDIKFQGEGIGSEVLKKIRSDYSDYDITLYALKESNANNFYLKNGFQLMGSIEWDNHYLLKAQKATS